MENKEKLSFLSVLIVTFMIGFDTTGLAVAIPEIANTHGFGVKMGSWLSLAYTAGFAAFLLPAGIITDKFGCAKSLMVSLSVFLVSSIAVTYCQTLETFIATRLAQGISAAFLNTASMALLNVIYPVGHKSRMDAFKQWSMFLGLSFALGPILGSFAVAYLSWSMILWVNLPLSIIVIMLSKYRETETIKSGNLGKVSLVSTLPMTGLLLIVSLSSMLNPVLVWVSIIVFLLASAYMHRSLEDSFTRLPELRNKRFVVSLALPILFSIAYWSLFVDLPGIIQLNFEYSAMQIMLFMLCLALPLTLVPLFKIQEKLKISNVSGFVFLFSGLLGIAFVLANPALPVALILSVSLFLMGSGAALLNPVMARIVMDKVKPENSGLAAALTSTLRQSGFAVGVAYYSLMTIDSEHTGVASITDSEAFLYASLFPLLALIICLCLQRPSR